MIGELMVFFVSTQLKATLVIAIGLLFVTLLRRVPTRNSFIIEQNLVLKMTMIAVLVMPLLHWWLPQWKTPGGVFELTVFPSQWSSDPLESASLSTQWVAVAAIGYLLLACVVVAGLVLRYLLVSREITTFPLESSADTTALFRRLQAELNINNPVELRIAPDNISPFVWGLRKTLLIVPEAFSQWDNELKKDVLVHELLHIKYRDHVVILLSHCCRALYWINPLSWYLHRRLQTVTEETCDARVVNVGSEPSRYAEHLLHVAKLVSSKTTHAICSMASHGDLGNRLTAIINQTERRKEMTRLKLLLSAAICAGLVLPVAALKSVPAANAAGLGSQPFVALHKEIPHYPDAAKQGKIEGYVVVEFDINRQSQTENLTIVDAQPAGVFEESALTAVSQFLYQPATANGIPQVSRGIRNKLTYKLSAD